MKITLDLHNDDDDDNTLFEFYDGRDQVVMVHPTEPGKSFRHRFHPDEADAVIAALTAIRARI